MFFEDFQPVVEKVLLKDLVFTMIRLDQRGKESSDFLRVWG